MPSEKISSADPDALTEKIGGFANTRQVKIEWGDCDPAGIVFYPRYFAMFDASTMALFEAAGFGKRDLQSRYGVIGYPMVETKATFKIPSVYGDVVEIRSRVEAWHRTSFSIIHQLFRGEDLAIDAHELRVWAGRDPGGRFRGMEAPSHVVKHMLGEI